MRPCDAQSRAVGGGELTVNFPVAGSNPTCTVCSKSTGGEMSIFLPSTRARKCGR